jgi:hypothetical protein
VSQKETKQLNVSFKNCDDLHHGYFIICVRQPFVGSIDEHFKRSFRQDHNASINNGPLRMEFQNELGDDTKVAASSSDTKEEVWVFGVASC